MNEPNVITLFGLNAAGKTTIGLELAQALGNAPVLQSSRLLMNQFGCDRQSLESMSPIVKKQAIHDTLLKLFDQHSSAPYVIADMHLLVNIHKDDQTIRQNMWSTDYAKNIRAAFFLDVPADEIQRRRIEDYNNTGRIRDTHIEHIKQDRLQSLDLFQNEPLRDLHFAKVINCMKPVKTLVSEILGYIK